MSPEGLGRVVSAMPPELRQRLVDWARPGEPGLLAIGMGRRTLAGPRLQRAAIVPRADGEDKPFPSQGTGRRDGRIPSMDLFDHALKQRLRREAPLAARMRPRTLGEFVGQEEIVGPGRLLHRAIEADRLFSSIILWGPPGTGKTTLAMIIANTTRSHFETISAVLAGKPELRRVIEQAQERRKLHGTRTILFVDEVHRWNRAQQDALLPHVEQGMLTFIGATTENPYFEVIGALVSRSRIFQLRPLEDADVERIIRAALADPDRGYGHRRVALHPEALEHLVRVA